MRLPILVALASALAAPASANLHEEYAGSPDPLVPFVKAAGGLGFSGNYVLSEIEAGTPLGVGKYSLSARMRTTRFGDGPGGTREDYSAAFKRELYHATVIGRLGTSPPSVQGAGYHLAGGEAWFHFYGDTLGPEHPELTPRVWESSGTAPSLDAFDREWVTRVGGRYQNLNNHLNLPRQILVVVENTWQLEVDETWRRNTMVGLQLGFDRYNRTLLDRSPVVLKDNIDYPGGIVPVTGWPNNWLAAIVSQRIRQFTFSVAGTRLNLLNNGLETHYSTQAAWEISPHWKLRLAYGHRRRRLGNTREAVLIGVSRLW